jgi:hypothetical protein
MNEKMARINQEMTTEENEMANRVSSLPTEDGPFATDGCRRPLKIEEVVLDLISGELAANPRVAAETVQERVYLSVVNRLQAGSVPEYVAKAAANLYEELIEAISNPSIPERRITTEDFQNFLESYLWSTYSADGLSRLSAPAIYDFMTERGFTSVTIDDITTAKNQLMLDGKI